MADHRYLASRGYVVVVQDIRGRHASDGVWHSMFQDDRNTMDAQDGFDSAVWASQLPHSNGDVVAWGHSYDAWCAFQMATTSPPPLRAIYAGGMTVRSKDFNFGLFETGRRMEWTAAMALDAVKRVNRASDFETSQAVVDFTRNVDRYKWLWFTPVSQLPESSFGPLTVGLKDLFRDSHNEFFDLVRPELAAIPTLHVSGIWDRFSRSADNPRLLGSVGDSSEHKVVFGPWGHHPINFTFSDLPPSYQTPQSFRGEDILLDWVGGVLGNGGALAEGPRVWYFTLGSGEWHASDSWPPPDTKEQSLFLSRISRSHFGEGHSGALLPSGNQGASASTFRYDPRDPNMYIGGIDLQDAPMDLRLYPKHPQTLTFVSQPFTESVEVTGSPVLELWAVSSAADTDWAAVLVHCLAEGPEILLCPSIVRARYRHGSEASLPNPGQPHQYLLEFRPVAVRFRAGDRLRLDISSSLFPGFSRNHNTGDDPLTDADFEIADQSVLHSAEFPSRIRLPVLSRRA